jgi:hypothetical protein
MLLGGPSFDAIEGWGLYVPLVTVGWRQKKEDRVLLNNEGPMPDLWWAAPLTDERARNVLLYLNPNADAVSRVPQVALFYLGSFSCPSSNSYLVVGRNHLKVSPSAKQALSPKDNPSGRVCATRSPTSLACSEVNGTGGWPPRRESS